MVVYDHGRGLDGLGLADDLLCDVVPDFLGRGHPEGFPQHLLADMVESFFKVFKHFFGLLAHVVLYGLYRLGGQRRYLLITRAGQQAAEQVRKVVFQLVADPRRVRQDIQQDASGGPAGAVVEELRQYLDFTQQGGVLLLAQGIEVAVLGHLGELNRGVLDVGICAVAEDLVDALNAEIARHFVSHVEFSPFSRLPFSPENSKKGHGTARYLVVSMPLEGKR